MKNVLLQALLVLMAITLNPAFANSNLRIVFDRDVMICENKTGMSHCRTHTVRVTTRLPGYRLLWNFGAQGVSEVYWDGQHVHDIEGQISCFLQKPPQPELPETEFQIVVRKRTEFPNVSIRIHRFQTEYPGDALIYLEEAELSPMIKQMIAK